MLTHDLPGILFGELYDILLYELSHTTGAPVTLTELEGQPGQLRDKPAQPVLQWGVTADPARLEKHTFTAHTGAGVGWRGLLQDTGEI